MRVVSGQTHHVTDEPGGYVVAKLMRRKELNLTSTTLIEDRRDAKCEFNHDWPAEDRLASLRNNRLHKHAGVVERRVLWDWDGSRADLIDNDPQNTPPHRGVLVQPFNRYNRLESQHDE